MSSTGAGELSALLIATWTLSATGLAVEPVGVDVQAGERGIDVAAPVLRVPVLIDEQAQVSAERRVW